MSSRQDRKEKGNNDGLRSHAKKKAAERGITRKKIDKKRATARDVV